MATSGRYQLEVSSTLKHENTKEPSIQRFKASTFIGLTNDLQVGSECSIIRTGTYDELSIILSWLQY